MKIFLSIVAMSLILNPTAQASLEPKVVEIPQEKGGAVPLEGPLTIATWNMQWFPGQRAQDATKEGEAKQTKAVSKILAKEKPAILFAAEVRSLPHLKKVAPGQASVACTQIPRTEEEGLGLYNQGLGLASRVPWEKVWALDFSELSPGPDRPYRGILGARFKLKQGTLYLYGVHLKSNRGHPDSVRLRRERAMEYLRWDWRRLGIDPHKDRILLVGDFNTSLNMPRYLEEQTLRSLLKEGFVDAAQGLPAHKRVTLPASKDGKYPPADFDQILLSPALAADMTTNKPWATIVPTPGAASDHYLMKIQLPLSP